MAKLCRLELDDVRCFTRAVFEPDPSGISVITGPNGSGKTTVLEAIVYLGTQRSLRSGPTEAMIRVGVDRAYLRADLATAGNRTNVVAELVRSGRSRARLNHQVVRARRELVRALPVTVFSPGDLVLIQGGPRDRRELLDDALRLLDPMTAAVVDDVERIVRQRGALLRQAVGRPRAEVATSLDVWDDRLSRAGTVLVAARRALVDRLTPRVARAYHQLAGAGDEGAPTRPFSLPHAVVSSGDDERVGLEYRASWSGELRAALAAARADDLRRGVTSVGPHRDDLGVHLEGREARTQASQGEQRGLALAIRLAVHQLVTEELGEPPLLLLDDVFSELDRLRSGALLEALPQGQVLVTSAIGLPASVRAATVVDVRDLLGPGPGEVAR